MKVSNWLSRCIPGLSTISLVILLELSLKIVETEWISFFYPAFLLHQNASLIAQVLFVSYSLFLHLLALTFPLRLCAAVYFATKQIEETHLHPKGSIREDVPGPSTRLKSIEAEGECPIVTMAIIVPSYKEEVDILETSLRVLASHRHAKTSYDVCTYPNLKLQSC